MNIVQYGHPALRWKSQPIARIDSELRATVRRMFELMYEANGIGLASNQVGLPYRFFIVNITADSEQTDEEFVFINPEIDSRKGSVEGEEGCLSLPEVYGTVRRAEQIVVTAFDLNGQEFEMQLQDLPARVVQHENDHLDGVLFPDRMIESARRELAPRLQDFESQFKRHQQAGHYPAVEEIKRQLHDLERKLETK